MSPNTASELFKNIMTITNRDLRKLYTTYVYNQPAEKSHNLRRQEAKIQGHSIETAKSIYNIKNGNK